MDVVVGASGPNGIKEDRLDALLERLDKLASHVEKSSTTIYQRRFIAFDLGNPGPIGLFAFGISLAFYMASQAHITEQSSQFIAFPLGMFMGGLTMLVTGFLELLRKNSLGASAFAMYGSFYMSFGVYGTIKAAGIFFLDSPHGEQAISILMGFASVVFFFVSFSTNLVQPVLFFNLAVMFFLLAGGFVNDTCGRVAGWWGIYTAGTAFYGGAALLLRDMWGRDVLPQFYSRHFNAYDSISFPRVVVQSHEAEQLGEYKHLPFLRRYYDI